MAVISRSYGSLLLNKKTTSFIIEIAGIILFGSKIGKKLNFDKHKLSGLVFLPEYLQKCRVCLENKNWFIVLTLSLFLKNLKFKMFLYKLKFKTVA